MSLPQPSDRAKTPILMMALPALEAETLWIGVPHSPQKRRERTLPLSPLSSTAST